ncbi:nucleotidyltransferase [Providencia rettgeri]|uniref:nucleotidyltransferase domain-containing protein n=1 Tax=Morganellaceae TaxID=1903414 RepID=UPI000D69662F|nr:MULTISPECIES: nucleotidyltransferase [Morganellaceae]EIU7558991.1 nucleotidyltransferase [Providencia rettgeri]ELR5167668.1 nucleotidyltransferase [Providencia rettgeri]MCB4843216.1 nucleotidyltransferase [Providencia rettgeri]
MINTKNNYILNNILEKIELPDSAYEKAEKRYQDLGDWLHRPESICVNLDPHVFSQGSFRLGTAIKPDSEEQYDLDMGCNLRRGLDKISNTQLQLKHLVGYELKLYRKARGIKEELTEKKRCWRLEYADGLSFHLDIVPCIPESDDRRSILKKRMVENSQFDDSLAQQVSQLAVSITDNTDPGYTVVNDNWRISNPEGYARWFETRMKTAHLIINEREMRFKASIDTLPFYQWKTPLQQVIQLLKRHRDTMFKDNEDSKPISVIITTLAAKSYKGESDLISALNTVLAEMDSHINAQIPLVPNPVNPVEDFADKWYDQKSLQYRLKENFYKWLYQARADFKALCSQDDAQRIVDAAQNGLDLKLDSKEVALALGISAVTAKPTFAIQPSDPKPWFK